jgi:hypothetical protein
MHYNIFDIPISLITSLTPEKAVSLMRALFHAECYYAELNPSVLTISERLTVPDGGIDAEINIPNNLSIPKDCLFQIGLTGFQIKAGSAFKPWTKNEIWKELVQKKTKKNTEDNIKLELLSLLQRNGHYTLICTGHDLTPQQRNQSKLHIGNVLAEKGFKDYKEHVEVLGASQLAEFIKRYPGVANLLQTIAPIEAWSLDVWQKDAHLNNPFEDSPEQKEVIEQIIDKLKGKTKHIRVLGEAGIGKTRLVLEAMKDEQIAPCVLYIQDGTQFRQTELFKQIISYGYNKPLVLVIDDLPETELSEIWRHLKSRCGHLKLISIDHGKDETSDSEIEHLQAPPLSNETIKKIFINRVGKLHEIDRWAAICEGYPRVAQVIADNLCANPDDLLKSPTIIPIWTRFLHGYTKRDEADAQQIDCVALHLALFSRFGYEKPYISEAKYIEELIKDKDPNIGSARFQKIIKNLRDRRVLQGSKTLFFVPKFFHIYLWRKFWKDYGRSFDLKRNFDIMPESLRAWFMDMFRYANHDVAVEVINDILAPDDMFTSEKGSWLLRILAEANPEVVLKLLEATLGKWTDQQLLDFKDNRHNIVRTLEKIAVSQPYKIRTIQLLTRLAVNENSEMSNNSTYVLIGLFVIGPETSEDIEARLPAIQKLLRAEKDVVRRIGLKAMETALKPYYEECCQAKLLYFQTLVTETENWPAALRPEVCETLLKAVENLIKLPFCTKLAFQVLEDVLMNDNAMPAQKLNKFFYNWQKNYHNREHNTEITRRLRDLERRYAKRDLASRFQSYVLDVGYAAWDEDFHEQHHRPKNRAKNRAKKLVSALACRIVRHPNKFAEIRHLLVSSRVIQYWAGQIARYDNENIFLTKFLEIAIETKESTCIYGYLLEKCKNDPDFYLSVANDFLDKENTAWLGAIMTLSLEYDNNLFTKCLAALERKWIELHAFHIWSIIDTIPPDKIAQLLSLSRRYDTPANSFFILKLLYSVSFDDTVHFDATSVFDTVSNSNSISNLKTPETEFGFYWKNVCQKLIVWDKNYLLPLLDNLLAKMSEDNNLSYNGNVKTLTHELVRSDPAGAWQIIKLYLEVIIHYRHGGILEFLGSFGDEEIPRSVIADLPIEDIVNWIEQDPESRSRLIAHIIPKTLDDEDGGKLTRLLLQKYGHFDSVRNEISNTFRYDNTFRSDLRSDYLKRKRDKFHHWLAAGFEKDVESWIRGEIKFLDEYIKKSEIKEERSIFN